MVVNTVDTPRLDVTPDGEWYIKTWLIAQEELIRLQRMVKEAEKDSARAETALANWLAPSDIKPNEKIGVWYLDSLFQVESIEHKSFPVEEKNTDNLYRAPTLSYTLKVTVRTRGKHFSELRNNR